MKKLLTLFAIMLVPVFVLAATEVEPEEGFNCQEEKQAFEQIASQDNDYFIAQHVLINMATPMEKQGFYIFTPSGTKSLKTPDYERAVCYNSFRVKGQPFVQFVRAQAGSFREKEATQLLDFVGKVEGLSKVAEMHQVAAKGNTSFTRQHILINMADPFAQLPDAEAAPVARVYAKAYINGKKLGQFVRENANIFPGDVSGKEAQNLNDFADRIANLAR